MVLGLGLVGVAGVLILIFAHRTGRPHLIGPGLILFSAGILAAGVNEILRRYSVERNPETDRRNIFVGTPAVLLGITTVIGGLATGVIGLAFTLGAQERLYRYLLQRPCPALLAVGLAVLTTGAAGVLGAREWRGSARRVVANFPKRIGGAVLVLLGLVLTSAGIFELASPAGFDAAIDGVLAPLRAAAP